MFGDAISTPTSSLSMRLLRLKGDLEIGDDEASVLSTPHPTEKVAKRASCVCPGAWVASGLCVSHAREI